MVMLVGGEALSRRLLGRQLASHGVEYVEVSRANELERRVVETAPALILFDLDEPTCDGLQLLRRLRAWSVTPVIAMSWATYEHQKVAALEAGADSYVSKPLAYDELVARIRAALRRTHVPAPARVVAPAPVVEVGPLRIDTSAEEVTLAGVAVTLTRMEFRILSALAVNAGRVLTNRQLSLAVWGPAAGGDPRSLRVYIARLRQVLEVDPAHPRWLITKIRVGYCLRKAPEVG
jgi:two-component system KDP operon response regulator KdpE